MRHQQDLWAEATIAHHCLMHPEAVPELSAKLPTESWRSHVGLVFHAMCQTNLPFNYRNLLSVHTSANGYEDSFKVGWKTMLSEGTPEVPNVLSVAVQSMQQAYAESERARRLENLRVLNEVDNYSAYLSELTALYQLEQMGAPSLQTPAMESLTDLNAADLRTAESIVGEGLLNETGLMWLHAPDGAGKTLLALELASSIALGKPWLNEYECIPKRVLYLQGELSRPWWQKRTRELQEYENERRDRTTEDATIKNLDFCHTRFPLAAYKRDGRRWYIDMSGIATLEAMIRERQADVVIIDPLSKFYDLEENDTNQNRQFVNRLLDVRISTGVTLIILHHDRKKQGGSDESEMRGSSALSADADCKVRLEHVRKGKDKTFYTTETFLFWEKVRHAAKPGRLRLVREEDSAFFTRYER